MTKKIRIALISLLLVVTLFGSLLGGTYAADSGEWSMYRHDPHHTGYSTSPAPEGTLLWIFPISHAAIASSPAVVEERLYIGTGNGSVYCINTSIGACIWQYDHPINSRIRSSPAVANGMVYIGVYGGVYSLNADTGTVEWSFTRTHTTFDSSPTVSDGALYIGSHDGRIYCLDAFTGNHIWNYSTARAIYSSPAVASGRVYIGSEDKSILCLNASNGDLIWRYWTDGDVWSSPTVSNGRVYFGSRDQKIYCLDASTGDHLWSYTTGGWVSSSPAIAYDKVFVSAEDRYVYCLDAATGDLEWSFKTDGGTESSPAVADGCVYMGSFNSLYCLNASTGEVVWQYQDQAAHTSMSASSPAIADGRVYIASYHKGVYCFGTPAHLFTLTVDPIFYDNVGMTMIQPSSWAIKFPNNTVRTVSSPLTCKTQPGNYSICSVFVGETEVVPEIEPTITLHANTLWTPPVNCRLPTDVSISFRSSASYRGFQIDIDGNLTCNGIGRPGVPILLSFSVTGGNTWDGITVATTALDGSYSAVWAPSATGNYIVRAEWAGNATFPGSKASRSLAATPFEEQAVFTVTSNSTVSKLAFNSTSMELRFTVSGPPGTTGYTEVTIAKKLIANIANLKVYMDAAERNYVATSVAGAWRLTFTYPHSSHTVVISLGETALIDWMLIGIVSIILGVATVIVVVLLILKQGRRHKAI